MLYHHYIELAACLAGLTCYRRYWPLHCQLMVALCLLTVGIEITGHRMWVDHQINNNWLYNLFLPLQAICFLFFFFKETVTRKIRNLQLVLLLAVLPGTALSYVFHRNFSFLNSYASSFYLFLMLVACCLYFLDVFTNDVNLPRLRQPAFWVACALLFFTLAYILVLALWNTIRTMADYRLVLDFVRISSNTILYGGLIAYFVCKRRERNFYMPLL